MKKKCLGCGTTEGEFQPVAFNALKEELFTLSQDYDAKGIIKPDRYFCQDCVDKVALWEEFIGDSTFNWTWVDGTLSALPKQIQDLVQELSQGHPALTWEKLSPKKKEEVSIWLAQLEIRCTNCSEVIKINYENLILGTSDEELPNLAWHCLQCNRCKQALNRLLT